MYDPYYLYIYVLWLLALCTVIWIKQNLKSNTRRSYVRKYCNPSFGPKFENGMLNQLTPHPGKTSNPVGMPYNDVLKVAKTAKK